MNVLIVGDSQLNPQVENYFEKKGFQPVVVENIYDMQSFSGQAGAFQVGLKEEDLKADIVVLTEQPGAVPQCIKGGQVKSLYQNKKIDCLPKKDRLSPVVFLLDYFCESPMASTIRALTDAKELAQKKRRVYYLNRFIRTGGHEVEALYKEARNAGVSFIKYEDLDISYCDDSGSFQIEASDGVLEVRITTKDIFADGGREVGDRFSYITKKLDLWQDENGYVVEDRYFLAPVLTSRRGVFHITRDVAAEKLEEGLDYILSCTDLCTQPTEPSFGRAVVDGEKCVLCYSCYRACTHAAMRPDKDARLMENLENACEGCGVCASVCPGNAITLQQDGPKSSVQGKSGKVLVFCCENSAEAAMRDVLPSLGDLAASVDLMPVPCGGRIGLEQLSEALGSYGKVMSAVCMDSACRHFDGNIRACRQTERLSDMLKTAGMPSDRIGYTQVSHAMPGVLRDALAGFVRGEEA